MLTLLGGEMNEFVFLEIHGGGEEPKHIFHIGLCSVGPRQISFILL
jgi:hypothetical protein